MSMAKLAAAAASTVLAAAVLASPVVAQDEKVLRLAYAADIDSFDPDNGFEVAGLGAINAVYEGLVEYAPGSTDIVGLLAESWTVSEDQLTYTFDLRDDVVFHDGQPMTSAEVLAALQRRADERLILSYFLYNVEEMSAPDSDTLVLKLKEPQPSFLDNLASPWGPKIVGPAILRDHAGDDLGVSYLSEHADGTGPFKLTSFERGQGYTLERNQDYWADEPYFDRVEIAIVPNIGQQILQLQSGQIDMILHGYPYAQLGQLSPNLEVTAYDDLGLEIARVNHHRSLADPEVLKAVMAAINPELWVADAFGVHGTPALSLYPRAMLQPEKAIEYPTDMEAARAVIEAKGPIEVEIAYSVHEAGVQQRVADLLIAQLQAIGVDATARAVKQQDAYAYKNNFMEAPDLHILQVNPDAAHPQTSAELFYTTGAPLNVYQYSNPAADEVLKKAGRLTDRAERDRLYEQGSHMIFDDGGFFPLADIADVIVHRQGLADFGTRPAMPWNVDLGMIRESE